MNETETLELRKFALQMALAPVLSDEEPTSIAFESVVDAAMAYEYYLLTGKNNVAPEEDNSEVASNLELVQKGE